jgi:hypothetical protein
MNKKCDEKYFEGYHFFLSHTLLIIMKWLERENSVFLSERLLMRNNTCDINLLRKKVEYAADFTLSDM